MQLRYNKVTAVSVGQYGHKIAAAQSGAISMARTPVGRSSGTPPKLSVDSSKPNQSNVNSITEVERVLAFIEKISEKFAPLERQLKVLELEAESWTRESEAPSDLAFDNARALLHRLKIDGLKPSRVVPSVEGGIGIVFSDRARYADFECLNTGEVSAVLSDRKGKVEAFEVATDFEGYKHAIKNIREFLSRE